MVSDRIYELCLPALDDEALAEEEKVDKLENILAGEPLSLKGKALEDAVLGALWQWKSARDKTSSPPPARGLNIARTRSPAPWFQRASTPGSASNSPRPSTAVPVMTPGRNPLTRTKSSSASPFGSPKPSPRLPVAIPAIPHSPRLSAYIPEGASVSTESSGDFGSDSYDWLMKDDGNNGSSFGEGSGPGSVDFVPEMTPFDMLRSILQDSRSDEELEHLFEANGYDFGQTIAAIMESQGALQNPAIDVIQASEPSKTYLVGKSMSPSSRPVTPAGQHKSPIVCRYWLASGHCARADCRFAHEVQNHVCKYWLQGNCIAGGGCLFSHDPAALMEQLALASSGANTPQSFPMNFQLQDYDSFPALQRTTSNPYEDQVSVDSSALDNVLRNNALSQTNLANVPSFIPSGPRYNSRPNSRPGSRHASRAPTPSQPNFQDDEAFPSLGSAAATKPAKRHHGKRGGHGHHNIPTVPAQPSTLADVVRSSPSASPNSREAMRRGLRNNRSFTSTRETGLAAMNIPAPSQIPWLETGSAANQSYLKARQEAFDHGAMRNKFLQSAAQAWNRQDARGAKALSLRGQNENMLMQEKHREAARALYAERNAHQKSGAVSKELYVDLHGLHPEEAISYLADCLKEHATSSRPVYAICGTGHHRKNGRDKLGRAVRQHLTDLRYAFREFSVPGDRNNLGGILGIDPRSFDKAAAAAAAAGGSFKGDGDSAVGIDESKREDTKIMLVKEDPRKAAAMHVSGDSG